MSIFVVIPAYNEEKNIGQVLGSLRKYDYQVVVVDDGSGDKTHQLASQFSVTILRHAINRGQGAALQTGTEYALRQGAEVIVHFDADGQFLVEEIEQIVEPILSGDADVVLGSRFHVDKADQVLQNRYAPTGRIRTKADRRMPMPFLKRWLILPIARVINYFFTGLKLTDAHCGLRAMSRQAAEKIKIFQDGMSHNTEIVAQIKKKNLRFKEVPITVVYKEFGQGVGGGFKIIKELILGKMID